MRVTHRMIVRTALRDMQNNMRSMASLQEQLSSGKRLHRPSDDPFAVERALNFRSELQALESSKRNIDLSLDWLNSGDAIMEQIGDIVIRARSVGLRGADDTVGSAARQALAAETSEMIGSMLQAANTSTQGRYYFSGYQIDRISFTGLDAGGNPTDDPGAIASVVYNGDNGAIVREVEPGVSLKINLTGNEPWLDPTQSDSIWAVLIDLRDSLQADDSAGARDALARMDSAMDRASQARAVIGAKVQRLEQAQSKLDSMTLGLEELLSKTENVDMAEAVVNYSQQEAIYQASLRVNSRILPMSLLDYLT